jgi:hypothetical protein
MKLQLRIELLSRLGQHILSTDEDWQLAMEKASHKNRWFIPEFIRLASKNIAEQYLHKSRLDEWVRAYHLAEHNPFPKTIGIIMAGNIPLVGFHDFLSVFISGNIARIKPSSKDDVLIRHLADKLMEWNEECRELVFFDEMLKDCDAYIATGSNNSSRYFEYYFGRFPHIIRRNRTSVAVLDGMETPAEMEKLANDVHWYFGLGCRNITKIYVPAGYDFIPLLRVFKKFHYLADHHPYKNNYDYNLAMLILNKKYYMTNESLLLVENPSLFSPISQLNYEYYNDRHELVRSLKNREELQAIVGHGLIPFGGAQCPDLNDYADGVDTMQFLANLNNS